MAESAEPGRASGRVALADPLHPLLSRGRPNVQQCLAVGAAGFRGLADLRGGPLPGRLARHRFASPPRVLPASLASNFTDMDCRACHDELVCLDLASSEIFERGAWLSAAVLVYFASVHCLRPNWPKEAAVAAIFGLGASLAAWTHLETSYDVLTVVLFACLC